MSGLFSFSQEEMLSFFGVLVRYSVLFAALPFTGDRLVPGPTKILLGLAAAVALFPALVARGDVRPADALLWGASAGGLVSTVALEALFGLAVAFVARMAFDTVVFAGNLAGSFMGFATASVYDPHQETQSQVVGEIQIALAMLVFLAIDGHHAILRASLDSYAVVGMGGAAFGSAFSQRLVEISAQVVWIGIQISAPVAVALFVVTSAFGVLAKGMPQLNVLMLSFAASALVGMLVLYVGMSDFAGGVAALMERGGEWIETVIRSMRA